MSTDVAAVSVVIATHREQDFGFLELAVDSVTRQTIGTNQIVIAVDHNSTLADRIEASGLDVQIVRNDGEHRGASATRNAGAAVCDTPVIAFLDDDEIAEPDWLAALLPSLDRADVVGTGGKYVPRWLAGRPAWFPDELAWVVGAHHSGMPDTTSPVRNVWSGNMAVKADVFRLVGGFRESFGKSGSRSNPEDTDLCIRMTGAVPGSTWIYEPGARIHHAVPGDRSTWKFYLRRCFAEGRGKIYMRELLADEPDVLHTERGYLTRTIPRGLRCYLRRSGQELLRAIAMLVGVAAAGAGAMTSTLEGVRGRDERAWRADDGHRAPRPRPDTSARDQPT